MKTIATVGSLGSFSAVIALAGLAIADAPAPPKPLAPPPPYSALPAGNMTAPPKEKAPPRIPKTERVDGFNVADPPKTQWRDGKITQVSLFSKEEDAKDFSAAKRMGNGTSDDAVCFAQTSRSRFRRDEDGTPTEWPFAMDPTGRISAQMKPPPPPKKGEKPKPSPMVWGDMDVTAIHQERFVVHEDKKAHVEMTDVWVDPVTHGVRLIGKSTLQLDRIGSASHGVKLYAARGNGVLHIVARRERPKDKDETMPAPRTSADFRIMSVMRQPLIVAMPSGEQEMTQCGFAHVSLKAQAGTAETAMFEATSVFIDPIEKKEEAEPTAIGFGSRNEEAATVRVRPFRATVSSTWSSRDKEPVLSVSFGWAGREREM
jgi:hypothetical protein